MTAPSRPQPEAFARAARRARLRYGGGFRYPTIAGKPLRHAGHLARIRALAIPPAWKGVWICRDARGHLQATSLPARGPAALAPEEWALLEVLRRR